MNLPASLISTLTTEEELEAIMNDAAVIQGSDAATVVLELFGKSV
jgi:hypothetical protein